MKLYNVKVPITGYFIATEIEANNEEEAKEIAIEAGPEKGEFRWNPISNAEIIKVDCEEEL